MTLFFKSYFLIVHEHAKVVLKMQQGKIVEAEMAVKRLFGKEKVAEVMADLNASGNGTSEPEAGWFDLFSSRYRKGIPFRLLNHSIQPEDLCNFSWAFLIRSFLKCYHG